MIDSIIIDVHACFAITVNGKSVLIKAYICILPPAFASYPQSHCKALKASIYSAQINEGTGINMTGLLLILLIALETAFIIFEALKKSSDKRTWTLRRLIVNAAQLVLFGIMLASPGIDTSFRFTGLMILLAVRIVFAAVFAFAYRRNTDAKKTGRKVLSLIVSVMLICGAMVPAFLFTDYEGRPVTGSYTVSQCNCILIDESRIETFENDGSKREVPAYFFAPAEAKDGEKFPLVVFSHGAFGYYQSNASTYLELASNGYVVVSIEHPYHSFFTKDTSGKTVIVDRDFFNGCMNANGEMTEEKIYELSRSWMELRVADMDFAVDALIAGADNNDTGCYWFENDSSGKDVLDVLTHIDTDRIGLMGHSMGGATAVEVGKIRDDIDAVIDIDGTMLGNIKGVKDGKYIIDETPYTVPLFELMNADSYRELEEVSKIDYPYPNITIRETAKVYYSTYFEGSLHMDYTDLPLFAPFLAKMLGSGDVDHAYMSDTVNSLEVRFFDCYLKGEGQFTVNEYYPGVN